MAFILKRGLVAKEGKQNNLSYHREHGIKIRTGIGIRDMDQPNIQVPLVKRTTSFSYFYGSEWKMVIYGDQMPKTSCFSFPKYCIVNLLSLSVLVPM